MTKPIDEGHVPGARRIARISVPASPLIDDVLEYAQQICDPPETSSDNFLRDFGERFVPGFKPVSTVDLLMNAVRRMNSRRRPCPRRRNVPMRSYWFMASG
jgi:hypothetical protein